MHGWVILDKPLGLGSTQAVSAIKRGLREAGLGRVKVGHGGTLDPLASGVLPIAIGEATKLAGRMLEGDKTYEFTIGFGAETDTLDGEGAVIARSGVRPSLAGIERVLPRFTGSIEQVPPAFSALKLGGERAYDLARAGEAVALASRTVAIRSLLIRDGDGGSPDGARSAEVEEVTLVARVSKGTYIRSLARDIALALGTVGHVTHLRRIRAGPFDLSQAISLDKWDEAAKARGLEHLLLPLRAGLDDIPALALTPDQAGALRQGRVLGGIDTPDGATFATFRDVPVALVEVLGGEVRVVRGFNL